MRRSHALILLPTTFALIFAASTGCDGGGGGLQNGDAGPPDNGLGMLPDAHVVTPMDSGMTNPLPMPTLANVSPGSGSERGGTRVTLRGTSFVDTSTNTIVTFGGARATSVVVLDEVSIAATTPPGAPGPVTVAVTTGGGTAELPDGFRYHKELLVLSVTPARIPDQGGVLLAITGKGFSADTVLLFDRKPLAGMRVIDAEHLEGWAPSLQPGRPEIRALDREAETRRSDLVVVYATPDPRALAPGYGPTTGGVTQELAGSGFQEATNVSFGGTSATNLRIDSGDRLSADPPALSAGAHDVTVQNRDASGTLAGGYIAYDAARTGFGILGVTPPRASTAGGDVVTVVGYGFVPDLRVSIAGVSAMVSGPVSRNAAEVIVPSGIPAGPQTVIVSSALRAATATAAGAITLYRPITVSAISPTSGPVAGGTAVTITGSGFVSGVDVRIGDVPLTNVMVVSDTEISAVTVAGAGGPRDVMVKSPDTKGVLRGGFTFEEDFAVIRVDPEEGSIAGNTYVSVFGRGLTGPVGVKFGGADGLNPVLENGSVIGVRTQPAPTGRVDVIASTGKGDVTLPQAFSFYSPALVTGGAWGGPIEGSVNVAVFDFNSGMALPGMVVQLGYDADPRYAAITDANGLATISSPEIRGAQTITAGMTEVEFVTFTELNARNLTIYTSPYPKSQGPDDPVPPCPTGAEPPTVRGHVFRLKSSLDPVTHPGWIAIAQITYSQPSIFQPNPPMPATQFAQVQADGQEYEITVMRAGTVAVYATLFDFNPSTQEAIPRKMGIVRNVPAAPGVTTDGIDISLDIELNQSVTVRLDNPPIQVPGPTLNAVFPYLNLQSEGVIAFPPAAVGAGDVTLTGLPELATSQFFYMGGSFTQGTDGGLQAPYSLSLRESGEAFQAGLDLGPFVQMPQNVSPKPAQVIHDGTLSWSQGGVVPDITTIEVLDVTSVSGCCCVDINMNGSCEAGEPQMCGGLPQQFGRWQIYGQGGRASYVMPAMLSGLNAFDSPNTYFWLVQQAVAPRFNYSEFIYNQFSPFFWNSWSVWFSQFVSKEETE